MHSFSRFSSGSRAKISHACLIQKQKGHEDIVVIISDPIIRVTVISYMKASQVSGISRRTVVWRGVRAVIDHWTLAWQPPNAHKVRRRCLARLKLCDDTTRHQHLLAGDLHRK